MVVVANNPEVTDDERDAALATIEEALFPPRDNSQQVFMKPLDEGYVLIVPKCLDVLSQVDFQRVVYEFP